MFSTTNERAGGSEESPLCPRLCLKAILNRAWRLRATEPSGLDCGRSRQSALHTTTPKASDSLRVTGDSWGWVKGELFLPTKAHEPPTLPALSHHPQT